MSSKRAGRSRAGWGACRSGTAESGGLVAQGSAPSVGSRACRQWYMAVSPNPVAAMLAILRESSAPVPLPHFARSSTCPSVRAHLLSEARRPRRWMSSTRASVGSSEGMEWRERTRGSPMTLQGPRSAAASTAPDDPWRLLCVITAMTRRGRGAGTVTCSLP